ncbi:MAG: hypothetical protein DCC58_15435 [Chloroflexi bacterium]|nr:MAG: hypothetical protein DCC58_15435 [Chloroflexota bacterium]
MLAPPPEPEPAPGIPAQVAWSHVLAQGDVPAARQDHVLVANGAGTRVYLHGGRSGGTVLGDLWVFDSEINQWSRLAPTGPVPAARFGHNAVYDPAGQRLLLFGGQATSGFLSDIWAYVIAENRWEQLAPNGSGPLDRYGAGGGFDPASGSFYLTHGFTSAGRFDDTWRYAQEQGWQQFAVSGERPEARCLLRSVFDPQGNRLLLFGGQSNTAGFLGDLWAFDLATDTWRRITSPGPSARNLYSWNLRGDTGQAYLFGGATPAGADNSLWVFNLQTDAWSEVTPTGSPPPGRSGHDAVWLESRQALFVFGGTVAGSERNDIWLASFP